MRSSRQSNDTEPSSRGQDIRCIPRNDASGGDQLFIAAMRSALESTRRTMNASAAIMSWQLRIQLQIPIPESSKSSVAAERERVLEQSLRISLLTPAVNHVRQPDPIEPIYDISRRRTICDPSRPSNGPSD